MLTEKQKEEFLSFDEVLSYLTINECGGFIWRMNHDVGHDRIPKEHHSDIQKDINNIRELQQFVVDNLDRFNVDGKSANDNDGEYWKWYRFWDNWKSQLSNEIGRAHV